MNIEDLYNELENLKKEVWYLIKKTIPKIEELITGGNKEEVENIKLQLQTALQEIDILKNQLSQATSNIENVTTSITVIENNLQSLSETVNTISANIANISLSVETNSNSISLIENKVGNLETITNENSSSISSLSNSISYLSDSISALQTEIESAKKEKMEVIYDMSSEDPEVNWGYTTGATGNCYFIMDFSKYHTLRVFARLYIGGAITEIKVADRKVADVTMTAASAMPTSIYYLKLMLALGPNYNKLQISGYGKYDFSTNGTFTMEAGFKNDMFYVYRIEGIIK